MKLRLFFLGLAIAITLPVFPIPLLNPDLAITDDKTPVMIDVLANDSGSGGRPMILTAVRNTSCPGTAIIYSDGTIVLDPNPVAADTLCELEYDIQVEGDAEVYTSTVEVTITYTDGAGGGGDLLGVPTTPHGGCVNYGTQPPTATGAEERCCWRELLRAIDGQPDLDWDAIDVLKVQANSANKRLLCRAADYVSESYRPAGAGVGQADSRNWFFNDLSRMAQDGWMDDGGGGHGSNEILSPLYGTWHAAAYLAALDRARATGDTPLITKLEGWLRTYWVMSALTAHATPLTQTTMLTTTSCGGSSSTHTIQATPGQWNGLSIGTAGTRRLKNTCTDGVPLGAKVPISQPGHYLTALAVDWFPRDWNASGLGGNNFHDATRTVLLLEGQDYFAAGDGTVDLGSFSPPASRFGLTETQRERLRSFIASPTTDVDLFNEILSYVSLDDDWRPVAGCPMTFVRTSEATLSRFGIDDGGAGDWLAACNRNTPPLYAAVVRNDGIGTYLSPGNTSLGPSDESERQGEEIVANSPGGSRRIDRPGGDFIYRVEWSHANGFVVSENYPPIVEPPTQEPYGGSPHPMPGRLEAEHFDVGGQNVSWFDTSPTVNTAASPFRDQEGVDVQQDNPGRIYIVDSAAGEWLEYTVNLASSGDYALSVEYRSLVGAGDGQIRFEIPGSGIDRTLVLPSSAGSWQFAHGFDLNGLSSGEQVLRLTVVGAGFELDGFHLTRLGEARSPYGGTPFALPGLLQAEHYDEGDPNEAYGDSTPWTISEQNAFRSDDWVDAHVTAAGTVVSWIESGEWLEYTVDVTESVDSDVDIRYLSNAQGQLRLSVLASGQVETTVLIDLPDTGGSWQTLTVATLPLSAGPRVLRLDFEDSAYSLDWLRFDDPGPPQPPEQPVAHNDIVHVPQNGGDFIIPHSLLEANDTPAGLVDVDWTHVVPIIGSTVGSIAKTPDAFIFTPPAGWSTQSIFRYRITHVDDPELDADGSVYLDAITSLPEAVDDHFEVLPGSTVTIYHNVLLRNDQGEGLAFDGVVSQSTPPVQLAGGRVVFQAPAAQGETTFTYRIRDAFGNVDATPATVTLVTTNDPDRPTANEDHFFMAATETDGSPARAEIPRGEFLANDTLPDAGNFSWNTLGTASCGQLTQQVFGWTYTTAAGCSSVTWGYELIDTVTGLSDTATVRVDIVPAPSGVPDTYEVRHGQALTVSHEQLLANDDGHGLGLVMQLDEVVPPALHQGTLDLSTAGQITFQPASGFHGDATFTYVARNDLAERNPLETPPSWELTTGPVTVTITVEPPDVAAGDDRLRVGQGLSQREIPWEVLFYNDDPADQIEIVDWTTTTHGQLDFLSGRFRYLPDASFWDVGSDLFTYTVRRIGGTGFTTTATVRLEAEPACLGGFGDDFETDLTAWSHRLEQGGELSLTPAAAMQGASGLRVGIKGPAAAVRLGEETLQGASHPVLSFWFDPSSITMSDGQVHPIAAAGDALHLWFSKVGDQYRTRLVSNTETGYVGTSWVEIPDAPQHFSIEAVTASGLSAADGAFRLWIDDVLRGEVSGLRNHGLPARLRHSYLGGLWSLDDTDGDYFFDAYRSCHGPESRDDVTITDLENGELGGWIAAANGGSEVTVSSNAALEGTQGIAISVANGSSSGARIGHEGVVGASHLFSSFLLDPATLTIPEDKNVYLFGYVGPGGWRYHLRLGYSQGSFRIRQIAGKDGLAWSAGPWIDLVGPGTPQRIGVEWWQASRPGADDGGARLALDGVVVDERLGLDNDELSVASALMGATGIVSPGTEGTLYIDSIQLWRGSGARTNRLLDAFEPGLSADWPAPIEFGGSATVSSAAALQGHAGLAMEVTPGTASAVYLVTDATAGSEHLVTSFLFDPGTFTSPEGSQLYLFGGLRPSAWSFHLRLLYSQGRYSVRLIVGLDGTGWTSTPWFELDGPGTPQRLGIEWWQPSAEDAGDGGARLSIDGGVVHELLDLDNDEEVVTSLHLGAAALVSDAASGALYLDDVQIWTLDD
ncbi:MAG: Ig-like domain-containing protein [Acidobacteriota bacterium]